MKTRTAARLAAKPRTLKPRNPLATAALMRKGGEHAERGKKASRARQKADWLRKGGRDDG
ncbi:hypothetical protein [Methyloversatilis thermotolerans]|uniref:hypothetical protein n=1 Tax=Methyloversatilis thermotolerans TaxID=1346290 RepID=UPI00036E3E97|nr:hypothetical protein [Methyloversatilis thermotolerans]